MNTKHFFATLMLSTGVISSLHAADAPAPDQQDIDKAVPIVEVKPKPVASGTVSESAGKTRQQVMGELIEAIKDGSYVAPSELYPVAAIGKTQR